MQRIIYKRTDGGVAIIVPSANALKQYNIEQIAQKDVPTGLAYQITDVANVPSDRVFRNAWDIDEAVLVDGVGSASNVWET